MALLDTIKDKFSGNILDTQIVNPKRVYIEIKPDYLRTASEYLFKQLGIRFAIATGIDEKEHMEILYHFSIDSEGVFIFHLGYPCFKDLMYTVIEINTKYDSGNK
jgi:Ni,Fe-hydrogenase III component G